MANTVSVKLNWNTTKLSLMNQNAVKGLFQLGFDIASQARRNAPYVTGALRNTIRVQETNDQYTLEVVAGGTYAGYKVDYAMKREEGPNRNPNTEHYMENAANLVMSGDYLEKYFGEIL